MHTSRLVLFLSALLAAAFVHAQQPSVMPLEGIAAIVDEEVILQSELERAVANIIGQYANRQEQLPPRPILERQVLERLVLMKLQTTRAQGSGVRVSDQDVNNALSAIAEQNNMSQEQLRAQLAEDGLSLDDFRASLHDELLVQRLRQRFAQSRIVVTDAEVDVALANQSSNMHYHLAHILVALPEGATPEQIATGQQKIDGIKALIDKGEMEFSAAAVRYSDSPNALEGGDLGWRSLDEIPPAFATPIVDLNAGEMIGPIRGPSGFQLLRLVGKRDGSVASGRNLTQYQARHILIRSNEGNDAQALARIETLRARIIAGVDFAQTAREYSEDAVSKPNGGDLGWFAADDFGAEFGRQIVALGDGDISPPFKTQAGWHIVQRQASREMEMNDENRRCAK